VMQQGPTGQQPPYQPPATGGGDGRGSFSDFLNFRYMITPPLITVLWVVSVAAITIGAVAVAINDQLIPAILGWLVSMLWVRVVFEVMIVLFRINDGIQTIARRR
jgi:hypothetical protein